MYITKTDTERKSTNFHSKAGHELHVFPVIGDKPLRAITSPDIFAIIKPHMARRELETAHRLQAEIRAVFHYAIAHGLADYDPAQVVQKQFSTIKITHRAALTDTKQRRIHIISA